jgi:hypothetical protein
VAIGNPGHEGAFGSRSSSPLSAATRLSRPNLQAMRCGISSWKAKRSMPGKGRTAFPASAAGVLVPATRRRFGQRLRRLPTPLGSILPSAGSHAVPIQKRSQWTLMPYASDRTCATDSPRTIVVKSLLGTKVRVGAELMSFNTGDSVLEKRYLRAHVAARHQLAALINEGAGENEEFD